MKEHPILFSTPMVEAILEGRKSMTRRVIKFPLKHKLIHLHIGESTEPPPVGFCKYEIGDILWVRESFNYVSTYPEPDCFGKFLYKANGDTGPMKPSIHMPKEACRIFLEITDIRVERFQDISEEDILSEGIQSIIGIDLHELWIDLWDKINGPGAWDKNEWLWVIEFKKLDRG